MQFIGKKGIAVFVVLVITSVAVGFGSGLLVGRQFPAHRFERLGESWYVMDTTTGRVCNPFKDPTATTNPIDQGLTGEKDANGFSIVKTTPAYPPPCGK